MAGEDGLVEGLWRQQSIWSQTANRMKASIGRARSAALALTVGGAVLATLAARLPAGQARVGSVLAVAAAVGIGLVPLLRARCSGRVLRDWTRARSVSEALKSEIYLYLAKAGDYRGHDRDRQLRVCTDRGPAGDRGSAVAQRRQATGTARAARRSRLRVVSAGAGRWPDRGLLPA